MASVINQIKFDNVEYAIAASAYGYCETAGGTQAKAVTISTDGDTTNTAFTLIKGVSVTVKFKNTNSAASPTLNVGGSGAKPIYYKGSAVPTSYLKASRTYTFVYTTDVVTTGVWEAIGDITAVVDNTPTLAWGSTSTIGSVDGTELKVTMPAARYHTTGSWSGLTYTATNQGSASALAFTLPTGSTSTTVSRGDHTHTCSITNSSGTAVTSLTHGSTYTLTAGGSSTSFTLPSNTDTKVTQTQVNSTTYDYDYPLLMSATSTSTTTTQTTTTYKNGNKLYANPYSGKLTATTVSAGTFVATSDKRLKENIEPYSCEKSILELPVYTYNFIADDTKTKHIGCIAQELQEICPELVKEDEKGYLSINESKLVYLLLDEVKKLKAEVNQLKLDCKAGG